MTKESGSTKIPAYVHDGSAGYKHISNVFQRPKQAMSL